MTRPSALPAHVLVAAVTALGTLALSGCASVARRPAATVEHRASAGSRTSAATTIPPARGLAPRTGRRPQPPFAVGRLVVTLIDSSRLIRLPGRAPEPRRLVTLIRYPARGAVSRSDAADPAARVRAAGAFPLVVFGHGFAVTPAPYSRLLEAWARAGYVVAAPIFPLENANAPGGPNESDLINQPGDMSFVITRLLQDSADRHSRLAGLIDPRRIAVSGQSDGGETALAVAYDRRFIDRRVKAAMILSGAKIPGVGGFDFPAPSPPLLATQGTADTINLPSSTDAFYDIARAPKYLLTMFGAPHLGPYTDEQPQLGIVERVTVAFLDRYLKSIRGALPKMIAAGNLAGISVLRTNR
jgi:dienelactone hydrolase